MEDLIGTKKSEFESFLKANLAQLQEKKAARYQCYVADYLDLKEYFPQQDKINIIEEIQLCKEIENLYLTFFSIAEPEGEAYNEYKIRSIEINEKLSTLRRIRGLLDKKQEPNGTNIQLMEDILQNKLTELSS